MLAKIGITEGYGLHRWRSAGSRGGMEAPEPGGTVRNNLNLNFLWRRL